MRPATNNRVVQRAAACAVALIILAALACAQSSSKTSMQPASGALRHYDIKLADLPAPEVLTGPRNNSKVIPRPEGAELALPPGFQVSVYAEGGFDRKSRLNSSHRL